MKTFIKSILISFLTLEVVFAQIDTTLKDYFPMEIGNIWEYKEDSFPDYWHYQVKIIGDTIMPNGKTYRVFVGKNEPEFYRMDDTLNVYRYKKYVCLEDSEYIRFRLTAKDSTSWLYCISTDTHYVKLLVTRNEYYPDFGEVYETKFYNEGTIRGWDNMAIRLAKGLGDVYSIFEGPPHILVGAIINGKKMGNITSVGSTENSSHIPQKIEIKNYPNPFNSTTTIVVQIEKGSNARLSMFNILGQEINRLMEGFLENGTHRFFWNGKTSNDVILPSGIYFCLLQTDNTSKVRVINLIK